MSGTIVLDQWELAQAVLGSITDNSLKLRDIVIDVNYGVPGCMVWLVSNLYITTGTLYVDGEVVVCG
jgi:hypothetical protein